MPKIKSFILSTLILGLLVSPNLAFAEESSEDEIDMSAATSISITPVSKVLTLEPNTTYEDSFKVTNNGSSNMTFEVYATPYSFTTSADSDSYSLNFSSQTNFSQISRWITFQDSVGNWVESAKFVAGGGEVLVITYRITTPESLPNGGQYAVIFAHTISEATSGSGIRTEASPGIVVYGRSSTGETIRSAEISSLEIYKKSTTSKTDNSVADRIGATARVKNTGNVDFAATGTLKVQNLFGGTAYETTGAAGTVSILPSDDEEGTIMTVSDEWEETPEIGFFNVTWTVVAADQTSEISKFIAILPIWVIIIALMLLTALVVWIIILVRKRKERRSRSLA